MVMLSKDVENPTRLTTLINGQRLKFQNCQCFAHLIQQ